VTLRLGRAQNAANDPGCSLLLTAKSPTPLAGEPISLVKISCFDPMAVSKPEHIPIDRVYVPVKRRKDLNAEAVKRIAESILEVGQETPILVRRDKDRHFVLLDGLQRLEACKALGETAIMALIGSVGDFAEGKPNYELAAEVQRQRIERLKKLRLQREAAQKTEAVVQPLVQGSDSTNLEAGPNNSAQRTSSRTRARATEAQSKTLSEWIERQEREGGRY
jgi:hypothetical protein